MEYLPDPRTVIEDAHDREREERDLAERRKVIARHDINITLPSFYIA
jgi:hypothetical protein